MMADIIVTTLLLCMATGYLTKFGNEIEIDLVIPLAIFACMFHMLILSIDYVTDTDLKFFTFDTWVGYFVCAMKIIGFTVF